MASVATASPFSFLNSSHDDPPSDITTNDAFATQTFAKVESIANRLSELDLSNAETRSATKTLFRGAWEQIAGEGRPAPSSLQSSVNDRFTPDEVIQQRLDPQLQSDVNALTSHLGTAYHGAKESTMKKLRNQIDEVFKDTFRPSETEQSGIVSEVTDDPDDSLVTTSSVEGEEEAEEDIISPHAAKLAQDSQVQPSAEGAANQLSSMFNQQAFNRTTTDSDAETVARFGMTSTTASGREQNQDQDQDQMQNGVLSLHDLLSSLAGNSCYSCASGFPGAYGDRFPRRETMASAMTHGGTGSFYRVREALKTMYPRVPGGISTLNGHMFQPSGFMSSHMGMGMPPMSRIITIVIEPPMSIMSMMGPSMFDGGLGPFAGRHAWGAGQQSRMSTPYDDMFRALESRHLQSHANNDTYTEEEIPDGRGGVIRRGGGMLRLPGGGMMSVQRQEWRTGGW